MNRVLMVFTISLITGIVLPNSVVAVVTAFILLLCAYLICWIKYKRHFVLTIALGVITGIVLSVFAPRYDAGEIHNYAGEQVKCTLVVNGVPTATDRYTKFEAVVENINGKVTKEKVLVYVYDAENIGVNRRLTFDKIKFKLPSDQRNPGGFDYRKYLTGKEIFFTATANVKDIIADEFAEKTFVSYAAEINRSFSDMIDKAFTYENGSIFKGVLLGNKNDIDDDTLGSFRNSGLSHVMAVSGLHLAIIIMLINAFTGYFNRWIRFIISFIFVVAFVFITGMPVSVMRAAVMILFLQLTNALFLEGDSLTNLSLAALVILIPNPNAVYDIGFVMSFAATFGILCLSSKIKGLMPECMPASIRKCICVTLSAQIGTLPFSAMYFGQLSLLAIISNLLIVVLMPLIYIIGIPAVFIGWKPVVCTAELLISLLSKWASFCSKLPGQMQNIPINNIVILGLFLFSVMAMLTSAFKNKKLVAWLLTASLLISFFGTIWELKPVKGTEITFLNVGQADSALVQTSNTAFLIDTATEYMGESEISGYLLRNGLSSLDGIFVSHFDSDHCGGVLKILENIDVTAIYISDTRDIGKEQYKILKYASNNNIEVFTLKRGDVVDFSDIKVTALYPTSGSVNDGDNNASLVFRADNKDVSVLFTGDLQNDSMVENCDTDILKVSHHGSKNGTTEELLKKNTPEIAVMSLAENNSYGFPHAELMKRLTAYADEIYRTDLHKTVIIKCLNKNYEVKTMKRVNDSGKI